MANEIGITFAIKLPSSGDISELADLAVIKSK